MPDRSTGPATAQPRLAEAVGRLGTESAFAVLGRARQLEAQGRRVVHLEIGEPRFPTPAHVGEAAAAAIRAGETGYCPAAGLPELRAAAARSLGAARGLDVAPERVLVGTGAKPFLLFTVLATCEPGDEVLLPDPGFPIYDSAVRWAGATPVPYSGPDALRAGVGPRTKLVILNSPNNPTGAVLSAGELAAIAERVLASDAWVLSDEVYWRLLHDAEHASIAGLPGLLDRTVLLDSLSKTYAMTGWRCGFACVPEALVDPIERFFVNATSCVPPFVQRGAIAALEGPQDAVHAMVAELKSRRDLVVAGLNALPGVSCATPQGAFYAFPDVTGVGLDADVLAESLLEQAGVAVLAGGAFGAAGAGHLRLSYGTDREDLELGLERMGSLLAGL
jgi:aspartate/methionine/tyrosine aminotransferase